jgi:hypothetical protein
MSSSKRSRQQSAEPLVGNESKKPKFPQTGGMGWIFGDEDMIIRDNSAFLSRFSRQTLFTRPTQMGKSTLLSLANMVYNRNATAPQSLASVTNDANSYFVFHVDFLLVAEGTATSTVRDRSIAIDAAFLGHI